VGVIVAMPETNDHRLINARWVAVNGSLHTSPIFIDSGVVRLVEPHSSPFATPELDCQGGLLFPGLVDPHVHLREPGQGYKEGIVNGTRAALAGGVTTVLDMPNDRPPTTSPRRVAAKMRRFQRKSLTHFGVFQQATMRGPISVASDIAGAKVYLARSSIASPVTTVARLTRILAAYSLVAVHAEHEAHLATRAAESHHRRRPVAALTAGLGLLQSALQNLAPEKRPRVVLCHVSGVAELEWLRRAKSEGYDVWGETCPHYLLLTQDDAVSAGPGLQVNPPLRGARDQAAIWEALVDGTIDFLATDHAPHTPYEKSSAHPPSGMPGVEWLGPFLVTLASTGRITWQRALELGCTNAARCYNLPGHSGLQEGAAANLTLYAEGSATADIVTRAGYCPYPDFNFEVHAAATFVNGELRYNRLVSGELR
jgi:dihydroorotase